MCFVASIYQNNKKDDKVHNKIIDRIEYLKRSNGDGVGIIATQKDSNISYLRRKKDIDRETLRKILRRYDLINIHLRKKTSGKVSKTNIHFWKSGKWSFAHNGTISRLSRSKSAFSDSNLFFKTLIKNGTLEKKNPDCEKIEEISEDLSLWGRFILFNTKRKKNYFFGDWEIYNLNNSCLMATSEKLTFEGNKEQRFWGVNFKSPKMKISHTNLGGIFSLTLRKKRFVQIQDSFNSYFRTKNYRYNNFYDSGEDDETLSNDDVAEDYIEEIKKGTAEFPTAPYLVEEYEMNYSRAMAIEKRIKQLLISRNQKKELKIFREENSYGETEIGRSLAKANKKWKTI